jgi:hypothetical protein
MRALTLSMAFVEHTTLRISVSEARNGTNSAQLLCHNRTIAGYWLPQASMNSSNLAWAAASVGAV